MAFFLHPLPLLPFWQLWMLILVREDVSCRKKRFLLKKKKTDVHRLWLIAILFVSLEGFEILAQLVATWFYVSRKSMDMSTRHNMHVYMGFIATLIAGGFIVAVQFNWLVLYGKRIKFLFFNKKRNSCLLSFFWLN